METLTSALREFHDAYAAAYDDPEDCDDCGDIGERPCRVHGDNGMYRAALRAQEILGPCVCGHPRSEHHDEDSTKCRTCDCYGFRLPAVPRPEPPKGQESEK